jgi:hypothetical protein
MMVVIVHGMTTANAIPQLTKLMYNFAFHLVSIAGRLLEGRRGLRGGLDGLKQLVIATIVASSVRAFAAGSLSIVTRDAPATSAGTLIVRPAAGWARPRFRRP